MANDDKPVGSITHDESRANIPSAELEPVMDPAEREPIKVAYERRNRDLDPQLVWRGKDPDQAELTVDAPPIYRQEHVHPKALIDDLRNGRDRATDLFGHFGLTEEDREAEVEFYRHSRKWSNRMILGDALQVMSSLSEREGLRGQVQAIYIDPPYGIRFNSNFQWSTTSRDVKDGKLEHLTREPEQVKAFRDTWRDGIHSYLSYLRDRLTVARELLTESGSCFVQIGDENIHRVRALMDEVFGDGNFKSIIQFTSNSGLAQSEGLATVGDYVLWYAKDRSKVKYRQQYVDRPLTPAAIAAYSTIELPDGSRRKLTKREKGRISEITHGRLYRHMDISKPGPGSKYEIRFQGRRFAPGKRWWGTTPDGIDRLVKASRLAATANNLWQVKFFDEFAYTPLNNQWTDTASSFTDDKVYVVQTNTKIIARCLLMTTDPGDLVLDPTCGSGTTAFVAEQWGRRWITIDTSRVALALARARIMGAKYPWYLLADSEAGQKKIAEIERTAPATHTAHNDIRHGFVTERVPHITLKSIANNAEIDVIWDRLLPAVEDALANLNAALAGQTDPFPVEAGGRSGKRIDFTASGAVALPSGEGAPANGFMEWEVPREPGTPWPKEQRNLHGVARTISDEQTPAKRRRAEEALVALNAARGTSWDIDTLPDRPVTPWPDPAKEALEAFWTARIARQKEIDASIAAKADHEYLYDKPYEDKKRVRVAGPFTVESLSPHQTQAVNEHGEIIDEHDAGQSARTAAPQEAENYRLAIMENLAKAGVQQAGKEDAIHFDTLTAWPGEWIAAEGRYMEGEEERRAGIFIGPEYGTVGRADLVAAAREAADAGFDILISCAFNYEAHAEELRRLGRLPVLRARMNADLHMAGDLKAGGGNLFVVFGEPDIDVQADGDRLRVELLGVDIFRPAKGTVESSAPEDIACWFIDTDYSGESFFVRKAYFPGADVPYKALRNTLKGEIDEDAWESLKRTVSRPFQKPKSGRIAVKVINHLGDEVMKVMGVQNASD